MCGQWGDNGAFKEFTSEKLRDTLPLEYAKAVVADVENFNPTITLFGGEPMMHKDWIKILECIKQAGLRCNIVSNATLLSQYAEPLVDLQIDEIIFSLDGSREIHDKMRGLPGSFDRALEGFVELSDLKNKKNRNRPIVTINCTIFENNYKRLSELVEIAEEIQASSITYHHLLFMSQAMVQQHNKIFESQFRHRCNEWSGFVRDSLPEIDPDILIKIIETLKRNNGKVKINFYPNFTQDEIRRYYKEFEFTPDNYPNRCLSLWMAAYIFPNGDVRPYHSMDYTLGNVGQKSFKDIWNDNKFQNYRRLVKKIRRFPVCAKGCTEFYRY